MWGEIVWKIKYAGIAQLVEHLPEEQGVGSSSLPPSTIKLNRLEIGDLILWCWERTTPVCSSCRLERKTGLQNYF